MAKKIFKEQQRFRNWEIIALLAFLMIGLTVRFILQNWAAPVDNPMPFTTYAVFMLPMGAVLWYILSLRLSVRVTEKSIRVKRSSPWQKESHKIKWKDVEEIELVETSPGAQWSGGNITFNREKKYSLCGRTGVHLTTKDGEEILIGARRFGEFREALGNLFPKLADA